jgi:hypothetical protein
MTARAMNTRDRFHYPPPTAAELAALAVQVAIMRGERTPDFQGAWDAVTKAAEIPAAFLTPPSATPPDPEPVNLTPKRPPTEKDFPISIARFWESLFGSRERKIISPKKAELRARIEKADRSNPSATTTQARLAFAEIEDLAARFTGKWIERRKYQHWVNALVPYLEESGKPRKRKKTGEGRGQYTAPERDPKTGKIKKVRPE